MTLTLYVDGGNLGRNPSPSGVYYSVCEDTGEGCTPLVVREESHTHQSNNEAEYLAIIAGLRVAQGRNGLRKLVIRSDSNLVVKQANGVFPVKAESLVPLFADLKARRELLGRMGARVSIEWVPRKETSSRLGH